MIKTRIQQALRDLVRTIYEYFLLFCAVCIFFVLYVLVAILLDYWGYWWGVWGGSMGIWIHIKVFLGDLHLFITKFSLKENTMSASVFEEFNIAYKNYLKKTIELEEYYKSVMEILAKYKEHLTQEALLKEQAEALLKEQAEGPQLWYKQLWAIIVIILAVLVSFYGILTFGVEPEWFAILSSFNADPSTMLISITTWILDLPANHAFWDYLKTNKEVLQVLFDTLTSLKNTLELTDIALENLEECLKKLSELFDN